MNKTLATFESEEEFEILTNFTRNLSDLKAQDVWSNYNNLLEFQCKYLCLPT